MGWVRRIKDLFILFGWTPRGLEMLSTGEKAPDFTAGTHEGREVSLSDYAGKYVILWFYPEADTPG